MLERNGADERPPEEEPPSEQQPEEAGTAEASTSEPAAEETVQAGVEATADEAPSEEAQAESEDAEPAAEAEATPEEPAEEEPAAAAEEPEPVAEAEASAEAPPEEALEADEEPPAAAEEPEPVAEAEASPEAPPEEEAAVEEEAPKKKKAKGKGKKASAMASLPTTDEELFQKGRSWYVVHTYSGYEDKVRTNLEQRIKSMDAEDLVFRVVVPSVEEMEIRDGQRRTVPKKIFPGYVLVQMITLQEEDTRASEQEMADSNKAWMVVRNSPGVTGFVGSGTAPTSLDKSEVQSIMKQMRAEEPVVKVGFSVGQSVRVTDGPFADFVGVVDEINIEKGKVKVLVSMMGRETPVELDFLQVERL